MLVFSDEKLPLRALLPHVPGKYEPLLLPLAAILGGILLGHALAFTRFGAAWPMLAFATLSLLSTRRLKWICAALALLFAGVFSDAWHRPGPRLEIDASSREIVILAGCVVEPSVFSATREQFTLELDPGARARVTLPIEDDHAQQRLEYGERVEIDARVRRPRNFNNPGSFDYEEYLARQRIFWTAAMPRGSAARVLRGRCGSRVMAAIFRIRGAALDRIERLYPDDYTSGMMEAILIGESSKLEKIWTENFRRTGTFHALVISGAHVAVLAGVLLFLLRLCAFGEIPALAITACAAWLYAVVSGFTPPVARAAGGFTLYLIARFLFRRGRALNLLAAVAIGYLLLDPGAVFDASFQLSFCAWRRWERFRRRCSKLAPPPSREDCGTSQMWMPIRICRRAWRSSVSKFDCSRKRHGCGPAFRWRGVFGRSRTCCVALSSFTKWRLFRSPYRLDSRSRWRSISIAFPSPALRRT